uniref:Uncharacterized protein n=1 Tax=Setaria italica TaxID=4555 RepID=K3ZGI1_SETIT
MNITKMMVQNEKNIFNCIGQNQAHAPHSFISITNQMNTLIEMSAEDET